MWHVYILKCSDGSLYTGITTDLQKRMRKHNEGSASKYTRTRRPAPLLYTESYPLHNAAAKREIEIKSFSAQNKKKLISYGLGRRFPLGHKD